ncbi:M1 family aminopeptidase [Sphingobacterium paramultivorum]|uniref:M1 family aminopeptidase n=1 Tax=Sphingobacterium paramultivorum TaxID=2886510 RepID=UPI001D0DBDF4|nr:M1 family aminopeptidase [Sphingobacterium paramultivorum]
MCMLISNLVNGQKITHYEGSVYLDSLKIINASFKIKYLNTGTNDIQFYINKNSEIRSLDYGNKAIKYEILEVIEDLKKVSIQNGFPSKFDLYISYSYPLDRIDNKVFAYNPNWIELSLYTGWFPVNIEDKNYSYRLEFSVPKNYEIIGNGDIKEESQNTIIVNNNNHFDIPLVLSNRFQRFKSYNTKIKFFSVQLSSEKIREIKESSSAMYNFYQSNYGNSLTESLVITVNPFEHDMSYARRGFISLSLLDGYGLIDKKVLAHEIAHLWWQNAKTGVWEDWLNESFAEYSTLKWLEKTFSPEIFAKQLRKYEEAYKKTTKISQTKTGDSNWHSVAYYKGPYILYQLEKNIGEEKMLKFMRMVHENKISTTEKLIDVLVGFADERALNQFRSEIY